MSTCSKILVGVRVFFLVFTILACAVGLSGDVMTHRDNSDYRLTFWKFYMDDGSEVSTLDLGCEGLRQRLKGGGGTAITALLLQAFLLFVSLAELAGAAFTKANGYKALYHVVNFFAIVFLLAAWGCGATAYNQELCAGFVPRDEGFQVGYGLALLVVSWVVYIVPTSVFAIVSHFVIKSDDAVDAKASTSSSPDAVPAANQTTVAAVSTAPDAV